MGTKGEFHLSSAKVSGDSISIESKEESTHKEVTETVDINPLKITSVNKSHVSSVNTLDLLFSLGCILASITLLVLIPFMNSPKGPVSGTTFSIIFGIIGVYIYMSSSSEHHEIRIRTEDGSSYILETQKKESAEAFVCDIKENWN